MIGFFNGPPGVGKTFHATAYALHCLDLGLRIAVSWRLEPPTGVLVYDLRKHDDAGNDRNPDLSIDAANELVGPVIFRFSELTEVFGLRLCQVFKDEAQNDLGSRDWEKMPLRVRIWMSEHRHYLVNLFLYTQHFKFVDIYPRRLALGNVFTITKILNFTLEIPRPKADSETGELGNPDILSTKLILRPWKTLDLVPPIPGFWRLLTNLSSRVPAHYNTHAPHENALKKTPASGGALRPPSARKQTGLPF